MSRILKASYVNVDKNVVIDNTFSIPQQNLNQDNINNIEDDAIQDDIQVEENYLNEEEIKNQLQDIKDKLIEEAKEEANKIIENAKYQAEVDVEDIRRQAEEDIAIKKEQAYKEGFDKGYEEGKNNAQMDCQAIKEEAESILAQTKQERQDTINSLEADIIKFITDTTENILTQSFKFNPTIISLLIKKGLLATKDIKNLKIFVSEEHYNYVEENKDSILNLDTKKNNIEIIKDSSLKDTDCVIETEIGTIQCGIDQQLSSIKEALYYILN